jgi:hypothetical protein
MAKEKRIPEPKGVCTNCAVWKKFGETCRVFWEHKKVCTMKVEDEQSWKDRDLLIK